MSSFHNLKKPTKIMHILYLKLLLEEGLAWRSCLAWLICLPGELKHTNIYIMLLIQSTEGDSHL